MPPLLALVPNDPQPVPPEPPALSVVIPAHDEAGNLGALVEEVVAVLDHLLPFEIVCVDDASHDGTDEVLHALAARVPQLRVLRHARRGGQSLAIRHGVIAARAPWIATLDGDGQNDPADIPRLLQVRDESDPDTRLIGGWRGDRRDRWSRRLASRIANAVRSRLLCDATRDTGCGIKLFERAAFLDLPYFDHMHRYLPALMQRAGWSTRSVAVAHRARGSGCSHYSNLGRLRVGMVDLLGVAWLIRRSRVLRATETTPPRMAGGTTRELHA